jgi:hypothetical protein
LVSFASKKQNKIAPFFVLNILRSQEVMNRTGEEKKKGNGTNGKYPYEAWYDV